jgi:hypothetical protein
VTTTIHPRKRPLLLLTAALSGVLCASEAVAQSNRGPLPVVGLRAPDGEDEAAATATASLRRSATQAGFTVPDNTPDLEQLIAAFGCDDAVPVPCLRQISEHIHAPRFVYGSVRRAGARRATAPVRLEVQIFDASSGSISPTQQTELPRAQAQDGDRWHAATDQVLAALSPARTNGTGGGDVGTGESNGGGASPGAPGGGAASGAGTSQPPRSPAPVRTYIGFGAIGAGVIVGAVGAILGVTGVGSVAGDINRDSGLIGTSARNTAIDDVVTFNDLYLPSASDRSVPVETSGDALCSALSSNAGQLVYVNSATGMTTTVTTTGPESVRARRVCDRYSGAITSGAVMAGVGAALVATGVVLVLTDSRPAASAGTGATARGGRRTSPAAWALTPVVTPGVQGGVFTLRF